MMRPWLLLALAAFAATGALAARSPHAPPQTSVFRGGVEVIAIDVAVVDRNARPVEGLGPEDFTVTVDRKPRTIVSTQFLAHGGGRSRDAGRPAPARAQGRPSPPPPPGRDILIVVDEDSMDPGDGMLARRAAEKFLDRVAPADRVGAITIPRLPSSIQLTTNRGDVRKVLSRITTGKQDPALGYWIGLSEAFEIERNDETTIKRVADRECQGDYPTRIDKACVRDLLAEAHQAALQARLKAQRSLEALKQLADGLRQLEGPKTLVLVSGGLTQPESAASLGEVERAFASAQVTLYTLFMESMQLGQARRRVSPTPSEDDRWESIGIENITSASNGTLLRVIGTVEPAFERVASELSASYLLGIEVTAADRDGRPHQVEVKVKRPGVEVRARRQYVIQRPKPAATSPQPSSAPAGKAGGRPSAPLSSRAIEVTPPEVEALLGRAAAYAGAYERQLSALVSEERYSQSLWKWKPTTQSWEVTTRRELTSDYLLVKAPGVAGWIPFRDVFEVDGRKIREREDRLHKLFIEEPATAFERAKEVMEESARFNIGFVERNVNLPTLPLMFLSADNRSRFVFRKQGEEAIGGVRTWAVAYAERASPTFVQGEHGDLAVDGVFWLEPEHGTVVRSLLRLKPDPTAVEIAVIYRPNEKLGGVWIPTEMRETHTAPGVKLESVARYSNFRRFQVITDENIK